MQLHLVDISQMLKFAALARSCEYFLFRFVLFLVLCFVCIEMKERGQKEN
jgi:hypothetical protein